MIVVKVPNVNVFYYSNEMLLVLDANKLLLPLGSENGCDVFGVVVLHRTSGDNGVVVV
jgi:hypothetical protein